MPFGMEILEWLGYPVVKKFADIFLTSHHGEGRTCIASRGKDPSSLSSSLFMVDKQQQIQTVKVH